MKHSTRKGELMVLRLTATALLLNGMLCGEAAAPGLAQKADAVLVGEVVSGEQTGGSAAFVIRVDRVLKGAVFPASQITVEYEPLYATHKEAIAGCCYGIWFLRSSAPSLWRAIPVGDTHKAPPLGIVCYPMPKGMPPPTAGREQMSPDDLVAIEIAAALPSFKYGGIQFYLLGNGLLSSPTLPAVTAEYRKLLQSAEPQIGFLGEVGLVTQGDPAAIQDVPRFQEILMRSNLRVRLFSGIETIRTSDSAVIGALGAIATSPGVLDAIQFSAAQSLRAVHTQATLPFLMALLDNSEARIRHEGLAGISMFVENLPIQMPELMPSGKWLTPMGSAPYRTAETDRYSAKFGEREGKQGEFICFWKGWWAVMKDRVMAESDRGQATAH
jgi:hypothetical protein